jgi:isoaspartyl peptidase/L-asparaginase-like protein (Ntn-hydrolase superfamily)
MRTLATRAISEAVEQGATLAEAVRAILDRMGRQFDADVGVIAVDRTA